MKKLLVTRSPINLPPKLNLSAAALSPPPPPLPPPIYPASTLRVAENSCRGPRAAGVYVSARTARADFHNFLSFGENLNPTPSPSSRPVAALTFAAGQGRRCTEIGGNGRISFPRHPARDDDDARFRGCALLGQEESISGTDLESQRRNPCRIRSTRSPAGHACSEAFCAAKSRSTFRDSIRDSCAVRCISARPMHAGTAP